MLGRRRTQAGVIISTDSQRNVSRGNRVGWAIFFCGQLPTRFFENFRHPSAIWMRPSVATWIGASGATRGALGTHGRGGENRGGGPDTRTTPAHRLPTADLAREFTFLRREAAVFRGVRAGASGAVGRDGHGAVTCVQTAQVDLRVCPPPRADLQGAEGRPVVRGLLDFRPSSLEVRS